MGDFIKELNIIDFLGMLLPGSIFLLLSGQGTTVTNICRSFFGTDSSSNQFAVGVFLIVAGYLVGMLFHEVGDLTERWLWRWSLLDPRVYAAKAVGMEQLLDQAEKEKWIDRNGQNGSENTACSAGGKLNVLLNIPINVLQMIYACYFYIVVLLSAFQAWDMKNEIAWVCGGFALFAFLGLITVGQEVDDNGDAANLRRANQWIQTEMVDKQNCKKRVVFDGFHVMMRNLILVIALLNTMPQTKEIIQVCAERVIVGIMLVRYAHYSFLKYKYSYEDFLKQKAQEEKQEQQKAAASAS